MGAQWTLTYFQTFLPEAVNVFSMRPGGPPLVLCLPPAPVLPLCWETLAMHLLSVRRSRQEAKGVWVLVWP